MAPLNPELDGRFNGCSLPFQYVNPYYHELTARTCVNILGFNVNRIPSAPIDYQIGCDCIFPFAMNYKGQCIQEEECNEREAFGEIINRNEKNKTNAELAATSKIDQHSQLQPQKSQPQLNLQQQQKPQSDSKNQRTEAQKSDVQPNSANSALSKY